LLHRDWVMADPRLVEIWDVRLATSKHVEVMDERPPQILVVEPSGRVVPTAYGFGDRYRLGNLHDAPLSELWDAYRLDGRSRLADIFSSWFQELLSDPALTVFNWTERITAWSKK